MTTIQGQRARVVLLTHGIDPEADGADLTAVLEARGWRVSLEQAMGRGRGQPPRWSGHATLTAPPGSPVSRHAAHITLTGGSGHEVLTRILAKVLEKEQAL